MKTLLVKCGICSHWRLKLPNDHCPACGAFRINIGRKWTHIDSNNNKVIVRGIPSIRLDTRTELMIARELAE